MATEFQKRIMRTISKACVTAAKRFCGPDRISLVNSRHVETVANMAVIELLDAGFFDDYRPWTSIKKDGWPIHKGMYLFQWFADSSEFYADYYDPDDETETKRDVMFWKGPIDLYREVL